MESIYWPEMATGTVMWNVRGGLYVDVDLYASSAAGGERGMDPHNARRPDQIIVADRERGASYATGTDRLASRFAVLIVIIIIAGIRSPCAMDFHGRAKTE